MKKALFSILLIIALVVLPTFAAQAQKTLTIGGIAFLTGPAAAGTALSPAP
jgi:hypothetical protein